MARPIAYIPRALAISRAPVGGAPVEIGRVDAPAEAMGGAQSVGPEAPRAVRNPGIARCAATRIDSKHGVVADRMHAAQEPPCPLRG
ncbi:MAG: hypothetical protein ACOY45_14730 [Pseudomonadota bacterium]